MDEERKRPVRPRDAASVVLLRGRGEGAEVLMGRRRARAAFLPDIYVFPGGRVDAADVAASRRLPLPETAAAALARRSRSRAPGALLVAALRETFEETGLLLATPDGAAPAGLPAGPLWQAYAEAGVAPGLDRLTYIARAITPTNSHRRFNTRFFLADAAHARGTLLAESELLDLRWLNLAEVEKIVPVVDVTEFVLGRVRAIQAGAIEERVPLWRYIRDVSHVLYE